MGEFAEAAEAETESLDSELSELGSSSLTGAAGPSEDGSDMGTVEVPKPEQPSFMEELVSMMGRLSLGSEPEPTSTDDLVGPSDEDEVMTDLTPSLEAGFAMNPIPTTTAEEARVPPPLVDVEMVCDQPEVTTFSVTTSQLSCVPSVPEQTASPGSCPVLPPKEVVENPLYAGDSQPFEEAKVGVNGFLQFAKDYPHLWEILVGMYFQEGRNPRTCLGRDVRAMEALGGEWEECLCKQDYSVLYPSLCRNRFPVPQGNEGQILEYVASVIVNGNEDSFLSAIKEWQLVLKAHDRGALETIVRSAGWCRSHRESCEYPRMVALKSMLPGFFRELTLKKALQELPRYAMRCIRDPKCG